MLRGEGCEVALAADGEQAVALATGRGTAASTWS
jgi:CheY-like chemotaxis protein